MSSPLARVANSFNTADHRNNSREEENDQAASLIRVPSETFTSYSTIPLNADNSSHRSTNPDLSKMGSNNYSPITQLRALLWKSWIVRRVHYVSSCFEILCPLVFILLVAYAFSSTSSNTDDHGKPTENQTSGPLIFERPLFEFGLSNEDFERDILENFEVYLKSREFHIFYAPQNSNTRRLIEPFQNYNGTQLKFNITGMDSEPALEATLQILDSKYPVRKTVGFFFENTDDESLRKGLLTYRIQLLADASTMHYTAEKFPLKINQAPIDAGESGLPPTTPEHIKLYKSFTTYSHYINLEYLKLVCEKSGKNCDNFVKPVEVYRIPYPRYRNPKVSSISIHDFIGIIIVFSYVVFCPLLVKRITDEKSTKARELLRLIGMSDLMYWLSHFLNNFIVVFFHSIFITIILCYYSNPVFVLASPFVIFFAVLMFSIQIILFSMTITTVFNKPVIATIVTTVAWILLSTTILGNLVPTVMQDKTKNIESLNFSRRMSCLTPMGSIIFFMSQVGAMENYGQAVSFLNLGQQSTIYDTFSPLQTFLFMLASYPIYCFLIWYLDNVWPFQIGVPKSPFYLFLPSYWSPGNASSSHIDFVENQKGDGKYFEAIPENQESVISVNNVSKSFSTGFGSSKTAVDNLSLKIYTNQITVLLGHNGAGKSTTMNMITGMFAPSQGNVYVNGFNVSTQTQEARRSLSLCPQENIIFTELTVYEHLRLFAMLKGFPLQNIEREIDVVLNMLKLLDKKNVNASKLSGGMKRKLSLGIALIGNTNTLILDEPTSGMDPDARRVIWSLLNTIRRERTVLLTTHYMEEADALADRIVIMNDGRLSCAGSSFFLKTALGTGYRLRVAKSDGFEVERFLKVIQKYISTSTVLSNSGTEVIYSLETAAKESKRETMKRLTELFEDIENNKNIFKVTACGLSYSTLEDVFLSVGSDIEWKVKDPTVTEEPLELTRSNDLISGSELVFTQLWGLLLKRFNYSRRYWLMFVFQIVVPAIMIFLAVTIQNNLLSSFNGKLRAHLFMSTSGIYGTNTKTFYYGSDLLAAKYESIERTREKAEVFQFGSLTPKELSEEVLKKINNDLSDYIRQYLYGLGVDKDKYKVWINYEQFHSMPLAFNQLFDSVLRTLLENDSSQASISSVPIFRSSERNTFDVIGSILPWLFTSLIFLPIAFPFLAASYIMFPIQENVSKSKLIQMMTKLSPFIFWSANFLFDLACHLIAISLLFVIIFIFDTQSVVFGKDSNGSGYVLFLLMFLFGISTIPIAYILSNRFQKPSGGFVFLVIAIFLFGFIGNLFMSVVDLLRNFFGMDFMESTYGPLLSVFRVMPIFSFLFGYQKVYKMSTLGKLCGIFSQNNPQTLEILCSNIDPDKISGITNLLIGCCADKCGDRCYKNNNPFALTKFGAGIEMTYMVVFGFVFFALIVLYEMFKLPIMARILKMMPNKKSNPIQPHGSNALSLQENEDHDVEKERSRVEEEVQRNNIRDVFSVLHLRKNFGNFTAVEDLTFGVHHGECFGLLGVNGAGKTTTFSMLTGDLIPSSGNAFIDDGRLSLVDDLQDFQSKIGYCPQFDALLDLITGEETLYLFARLRGIPSKNIERDVRNLIKMVGLEDHAKKNVGAYSGGNKRKLSIAVALIGNPMLLFLDEPSAGVDPAARRKIWQTLDFLKNNFDCSIILTSHSMEECEALCSRLGIMVNGGFRCFGSIQQLRSLHGQGYSVTISLKKDKLNIEGYVDSIQQHMVQHIESAILKDYHQGLMNYHIADPNEKWSNIFRQMEILDNKFDFEDYLVSDTTLEQIFLMFARHQKVGNKGVTG